MSKAGSQTLEVGGDIKESQIAIGNYIFQVGDVNGGVVNITQPTQPVKFERRTKHASLKPRPFPLLLDRATETQSIEQAINLSTPVTLFGEPGIGKTSFLRHILNTKNITAFHDGLVYLPVRDQGGDDILQMVFDSFFAENSAIKPTNGQIRAELNKVNALIVLDDLTLPREQVASLLDAMPSSMFILVSETRSLWGEGLVLPLSGLPIADALALFTRELGRSPSPAETPLIEQICAALHGHPLRILEMASLAREGRSLQDILKELQASEPDKAAANLVINKLDTDQKSVLGVLASLGGVFVSIDHLRELANVPNLENSLQSLSSLGLLESSGSKYGVASSLTKALPHIMDLRPWDNAVVKHFAGWLAQNPGQDLIEDAAEALAKAIQKAGEKKDWPQVVRMGRALEKILILRKRWQAWADILDLLLRAARALGDKKLEGWALHQLGSRAMMMGISDTAKTLLSQALQIRKAIGDQAGLQISQHNLNVLMKMLPVPKTSGCRRWFTCGAVGAVAGGAFFAILAIIYFWPQPPVYTPPPYISDTPSIPLMDDTPSFTPSPTETSTATPTLTPSATNIPAPVILFDFINEASNAKWSFLVNDPDGAYEYPVPFAIQTPFISPEDQANFDIEPYAGWQKGPPMEDRSKERLVILAYPAAHQLSGLYDLQNYVIQSGDTLVVKVGFKQAGNFSADADGVRFTIIFANESADVFETLFEMADKMDGQTFTKEIDLSPFAGQAGNFILRVWSEQTYVNDFSVWADAYIQRP